MLGCVHSSIVTTRCALLSSLEFPLFRVFSNLTSKGAVRLVASGFAAVGLMLVKIGVRGPMVVFGSRQNSHKERTP